MTTNKTLSEQVLDLVLNKKIQTHQLPQNVLICGRHNLAHEKLEKSCHTTLFQSKKKL